MAGQWTGRRAWDGLIQDLRYTVRTLRRDAGFGVFALLILGLGIGANTAVFSIAQPLLLRPLPFHEPERLVWIANTGGAKAYRRSRRGPRTSGTGGG